MLLFGMHHIHVFCYVYVTVIVQHSENVRIHV